MHSAPLPHHSSLSRCRIPWGSVVQISLEKLPHTALKHNSGLWFSYHHWQQLAEMYLFYYGRGIFEQRPKKQAWFLKDWSDFRTDGVVREVRSDNQHGLRENPSTLMTIMDFVESTTTATDNQQNTLGLFIDVIEVFDSGNHSIPFSKMWYYGIRGIVQRRWKSCQSDRKQYI